jgi:hypothetical protein
MQQFSYCKETDDYDIWDDYGGSSITLRETKKFLRLIKKTHPELFEEFGQFTKEEIYTFYWILMDRIGENDPLVIKLKKMGGKEK